MANFIRVLLIEDLEMAQKVAAGILIDMGHEVAIAEKGEMALNLLISKRFDLILLDLDLPDISGFSISETIRSLEKSNKRKVIIALTVHSTEDLPAKCTCFGIDDYIIKPLSYEKARYTLSNVIF